MGTTNTNGTYTLMLDRAYTYFENSSYCTVYYFRIADGWHTSSRYVNANIGLNSIDAVAVHIN